MDITEVSGKWRVAFGYVDAEKPSHLVKDQPFPYVENRETGEIKILDRAPSSQTLGFMPYEIFMRKCNTAFQTGSWPKTRWSSGRITD